MDKIEIKWEQIEFDRCPFCECCEYLEGPHGAGSVNFKCSLCGATFNDMGGLGVELIGWPETDPLDLGRLG